VAIVCELTGFGLTNAVFLNRLMYVLFYLPPFDPGLVIEECRFLKDSCMLLSYYPHFYLYFSFQNLYQFTYLPWDEQQVDTPHWPSFANYLPWDEQEAKNEFKWRAC
jgi:hypothetical protein